MEQTYYGGANNRILERVPASAKRILELGCAAGRLGEILKEQISDREIWGIEAVAEIAAEAKKRLDHVIVGDVEQMDPLPLPNERYFDCLICGDVLEHLRDPQKVLERLRKHLAPGATVIVNVPNIAHWSVVHGLMQGQFAYADNGLLDKTHLRFFTPSSLRDMLWEAGYLVVEDDALEVELTNAPPLREVRKAFGMAATALGIDSSVAQRNTSIYQQLYVAKPVPDPYTEPDKMSALVGPHIGKLGRATKRASVVVLTYNSMKTIETCLNTVLPTLGPNDELILVDNASQDGTPTYLESLISSIGSIQLFCNDENLGFSKGCNIGMLQSSGEYLILLNPDTQVSSGWIEGLIAPFAEKMVGAVGPLSDNVCGDQFVGLFYPHQTTTSSELMETAMHSSHLAIGSQPLTVSTKLLIGFCLALRRDLCDKFGLLDERCFLGADDLELSWRLRMLGYELRITSTFVAHKAGESFATLKSGEKDHLVFASDAALLKILREYYGSQELPSSVDLWDNPIFDEALNRPVEVRVLGLTGSP